MTTAQYESDRLPEETVDVVVIGGGPAGLNGALMLARSRRTVLVIDGGSPRNAPAEAMHGLIALDGIDPAELLRRGRDQVRGYGGRIVLGEVATAAPAAPAADGDLRFTVALADGRTVTARRILVAAGVTDTLPQIPGLAAHWGRSVVHCAYCHGWEVRDAPLGVLATGPISIDHALMFRQLTADLIYFAQGGELSESDRARLAARDIRVIDTAVQSVVDDQDGALAGVRLTDGRTVARRVIAVAPRMEPRIGGLAGLQLPREELPGDMGRRVASGMAGTTEVPGVWVAGNVAEPTAQVGASAAAGALAGAHINAMLVAAETDAALAAARAERTAG